MSNNPESPEKGRKTAIPGKGLHTLWGLSSKPKHAREQSNLVSYIARASSRHRK